MKNLMLIALIALSFSSTSQAWEKIFNCNNEAFVIDRECAWQGEFPRKFNCNYQMVFNDRGVLDFLTKDTNTSYNNRVVGIKAVDGYGRFETEAIFGYKLAVFPGPNSSGLEVKMQSFYHGTLITKRNWTFENCELVNRY